MLLPVVVLPLLAGTPASSTHPAEVVAAEAPANMDQRVHAWFEAATRSRDAVIAGDLKRAKAAAGVLANDELKGAPETWQPHLAAVKSAATMTAKASVIEEAALGVAKVGEACGACHTALEAGPKKAQVPAQTFGEAAPHMSRHQWGASWMWYGLITSSSDAWERGGEVLASGGLWPERTEVDDPPGWHKLDNEIHALARQATAEPVGDRARAYGALLVTCAQCHTLTGGGPAPR